VTYPGTYAEYDHWYAKRKLQPKAEPAPKPEKKEEKKEPVATKKPDDEKAKQLKKLNQELAGMEQQIEALEKTVKELETQLADDKLYTNAAKAQEVTETYQLKKLELKEIQAKWENLAEHILELEP
jgi:ATP-binding cassette subfamily F protein 3